MKISAGQVAVVTGGTSGIGFGLAHRLAERGVHVVVADVREESLPAATEKLDALGTESFGVQCDVSSYESVQQLFDATVERFGDVDIVANNAGVFTGLAPSWEIDIEVWRWNIDVLLWGVIHGHLAFVPHFVKKGTGHVINTASLAGLADVPFNAPYNAAKHGVVTLSETLRNELDRFAPGVGVTVVCPGGVATSLGDTTRANRPAAVSSDIFSEEAVRGAADLWPAPLENEQRRIVDPLEFGDGIIAAVEADRLHCIQDDTTRRRAQLRIDRLVANLSPE